MTITKNQYGIIDTKVDLNDTENMFEAPPLTSLAQYQQLPREDFYFHHKGEKEGETGWKLHLFVVPTIREKTTRAISEFLQQHGITHKIAIGGADGKGMTIYPNSFVNTLKIANELNANFKGKIAHAPENSDMNDELDITDVVKGRFWVQNVFTKQYRRRPVKGLCAADYQVTEKNNENRYKAKGSHDNGHQFTLMYRNMINKGLIDNITGEPDSEFPKQGWVKPQDCYTYNYIEAYASHKLYSRYLGAHYHGGDEDNIERIIFGKNIPPKGSFLRKKWDEIAELYIEDIEINYPDGIYKMIKISEDADKVPSPADCDFSHYDDLPLLGVTKEFALIDNMKKASPSRTIFPLWDAAKTAALRNLKDKSTELDKLSPAYLTAKQITDIYRLLDISTQSYDSVCMDNKLKFFSAYHEIKAQDFLADNATLTTDYNFVTDSGSYTQIKEYLRRAGVNYSQYATENGTTKFVLSAADAKFYQGIKLRQEDNKNIKELDKIATPVIGKETFAITNADDIPHAKTLLEKMNVKYEESFMPNVQGGKTAILSVKIDPRGIYDKCFKAHQYTKPMVGKMLLGSIGGKSI